MGLFMRPRRPMMRMAAGAATAGIAYHAGKKHAEQDQYNEQAQEAYAATQAPPPAPAPAPAAAPAAPAADPTAELERLAQLHQSGVLTDDEFAAAKAKVLGI
jgi:hypothetical protein